MRRYGFTGTQIGATAAQLETLSQWFWLTDRGEGQHGDCIGVDAQVHAQLIMFGWRTVIRPGAGPARLRAFCAGDIVHPPRPYLARNTDIVFDTEELVALPKGSEEVRSGTWATVRVARKLKRMITLIYPDGSVSIETPKDLV